MSIWTFIIGGLVGGAAAVFAMSAAQKNAPAPSEDAAEESAPTEFVAATLTDVRHDHDPLTLQGWTRLTCQCADGVERKMSFDGDMGVYLTTGETGTLEHREGVFVSFEKADGVIITPHYRIEPESEE